MTEGVGAAARRFLTEEALFEILSLARGLTGHAYVQKISQQIVDTTQVRAAFVTEIDPLEPAHARLLSYAGPHPLSELQGTALSGPPWFSAEPAMPQYRSSGARRRLPDDPVLASEEIESYVAVPLLNAGGRCIGYIGVLDDEPLPGGTAAEAESFLTLIAHVVCGELERRELERRLGAQVAPLRAFADASDAGFMCWTDRCWTDDPQPRLVYANPAVERIFGYTAGELSANPLNALRNILPILPDRVDDLPPEGTTIFVNRKDARKVALALTLQGDGREDIGRPHQHHCTLTEHIDQQQRAVPNVAREAKLQQFLDALAATIVVKDGSVVEMNERARQLTGRRPNDVLALTIARDGHDSGPTVTLQQWLRRSSHSRYARTFVSVTTRRGAERIIEIVCQGVLVSDASLQILLAVDVTNQFHSEQRLQRQAALNEHIIAALPTHIAVVSSDGVVLTANEAWMRTLQKLPANVRAGSSPRGDILELLRELAREGNGPAGTLVQGAAAVLSGALAEYTQECSVVAANGDSLWFQLKLTPIPDGGGVIVSGYDVTEFKYAARELSDVQAREREVLESLPDQIARVRLDGQVEELFAPTRKTQALPLFAPNSVGRSVRDVIDGEAGDNLLQSLRDAARSDRVVLTRFSVPYHDDERRYETRTVPLRGEELLVIARDRTADQSFDRGADEPAAPRVRSHIAQANPYGLTFREASVLQLMTGGSADKEIATQLGVSVFTVNKHVSKILHKLNATSRTEASIRTIREGLLE